MVYRIKTQTAPHIFDRPVISPDVIILCEILMKVDQPFKIKSKQKTFGNRSHALGKVVITKNVKLHITAAK